MLSLFYMFVSQLLATLAPSLLSRGCIPSKVIFHWRSSSLLGCPPWGRKTFWDIWSPKLQPPNGQSRGAVRPRGTFSWVHLISNIKAIEPVRSEDVSRLLIEGDIVFGQCACCQSKWAHEYRSLEKEEIRHHTHTNISVCVYHSSCPNTRLSRPRSIG